MDGADRRTAGSPGRVLAQAARRHFLPCPSRAVPPGCRRITGLASYLDDIREELVAAIQILEAVDAELVPELVKLRDGLVALRPEADDSAAVPPSPGGGATSISALLTHRQTLAYFDLCVAGEPEPFNHKGEGGKAQALLSVLQAKDAQYVYDEEACAGPQGPRTANRLHLRTTVRPAPPLRTIHVAPRSTNLSALSSTAGGRASVTSIADSNTHAAGFACGCAHLRASPFSSWRRHAMQCSRRST
ncbi:MAG: hypothetical protein QOE31_1132 [Solirubrobacteraceae bacterium]|nr:hypothetical protein [Solirubrobacteraceae bacterium]